jgi:hypothetical protein
MKSSLTPEQGRNALVDGVNKKELERFLKLLKKG